MSSENNHLSSAILKEESLTDRDTSRKKIYFENLDGLRTIAFGVVFLWHIYSYLHYKSSFLPEQWLIRNFILKGYIGVNLFFVLSGFLISYLLITEKNRNDKIDIRSFYIRRVLRIWPLYFLVVIVNFFVLPLISHGFDLNAVKQHLLPYVLFINNFDRIKTNFAGLNNDSLGVLWSVAVEEQFYFFWPILLALTPKKRFPHLFVSVIIICLVYRATHIEDGSAIYLHTLSVMSDLAVGSLLAYVAIFSKSFLNKMEQLPRIIISLIYAATFIYIYFSDAFESIPALRIFVRFVLSLFFAFIIAEQCFAEKSFLKLKNIKFLTNVGVITYGLYCLHFFGIMVVQKANVLMGITETSSLVFYSEGLVCLAISLLISKLSYAYFEKRFLLLKEKYSRV